jgi:hypothetical protein
VAAALFDQTGLRLDVTGPCPGGQVGAAYVRWPDGHRAVLTWRPGITLAQARQGPLAVVDALRAVGYPAPATELAAQVGTSVVVVQELLPGRAIGYLDPPMLDRVLALNRLHRGRLAGRAGVPPMKLYLRGDGPGFCLHEPLRQFSRRSAALERWAAGVGADHGDELAGDDAVHCDFHPGNMLASDGVITGWSIGTAPRGATAGSTSSRCASASSRSTATQRWPAGSTPSSTPCRRRSSGRPGPT